MNRPPPRSTLFPHPPLSRSTRCPTPASASSARPKRKMESAAERRLFWGTATAIVVSDFVTKLIAESFLARRDRKSTRLNSSHGYISYAVFCLKKKNPGVRNPGQDIIVVHRSDGSGTTSIFTDYLSKLSAHWMSHESTPTSAHCPVAVRVISL